MFQNFELSINFRGLKAKVKKVRMGKKVGEEGGGPSSAATGGQRLQCLDEDNFCFCLSQSEHNLRKSRCSPDTDGRQILCAPMLTIVGGQGHAFGGCNRNALPLLNVFIFPDSTSMCDIYLLFGKYKTGVMIDDHRNQIIND